MEIQSDENISSIEIKQGNRGSEWHKWDLHFHTPSSYDYEDKSVTNQQIIDTLIQNHISVVAITDHHFIDVDRIKELQILGTDNIVILPGIEFCSELGGSESVHFIGIFPEKCNIKDIWTKLQGQLNLTESDIEAKGVEKIQCDLEDTCKLIHQIGGITTVHAGGKSNTIEQIGNKVLNKQEQKSHLLSNHIDILELGNKESIKGYREKVFPSLGFELPLIICSDNHNVNHYGIKDNLWIKGETTFEGLRQVYYEPELRAKIQEEEPEPKEKSLIIDEVCFKSSLFTPKPIKFNKNLNVIIGGKSSGKSTLLYYIAYLLSINNEDDKKLYQKKDDNGKNIEIYSFHQNKEDSGFDFEVKLLSGASSSLSTKDKSILPHIKYIPQNYLTKLADPDSNKMNNDLNKIVRDLLNEDGSYSAIYESFINEVRSKDRGRESIIDKYFDLLDNKSELEKKSQVLGDKTALELDKKNKEKEVEELKVKAKLTPEQIEEYASLNVGLEKIKDDIKQHQLGYQIIANFGNHAAGILSDLASKYNTDTQNISESLKDKFNPYFTPIQNALASAKSFQSYLASEEGDQFISKLAIELNNQQVEIEKCLKPFILDREDQIKIKGLEESIQVLKDKLGEIESTTNKINNIVSSLDLKKQELLDLFNNSHKEYETIKDSFRQRIESVRSHDLNIIGQPKYNFSKFRTLIFPNINGRVSKNWDYQKYPILKQSLSRNNQLSLEGIINSLSNIFDDVISGEFVLNSSIDKKQFLKNIFYDYFYDYWEVSYKDDSLERMSAGKASFVILMLIIGLSKEKGPILIDQPEDNLDNRSIFKDLVSYLREKKQERQIILVTHNPNVVVNADAENVIVAEQRGQREIEGTDMQYQFDYINGALENSFINENETDVLKRQGIKEHVTEIVEGGEEAFIKRERKYNFKRKKQ